jgi:hypothetical protein
MKKNGVFPAVENFEWHLVPAIQESFPRSLKPFWKKIVPVGSSVLTMQSHITTDTLLFVCGLVLHNLYRSSTTYKKQIHMIQEIIKK